MTEKIFLEDDDIKALLPNEDRHIIAIAAILSVAVGDDPLKLAADSRDHGDAEALREADIIEKHADVIRELAEKLPKIAAGYLTVIRSGPIKGKVVVLG